MPLFYTPRLRFKREQAGWQASYQSERSSSDRSEPLRRLSLLPTFCSMLSGQIKVNLLAKFHPTLAAFLFSLSPAQLERENM